MIDYLLISSIVGLAAIAQSLTGFGFALVAMSLLPGLLDIKESASLVALVSVASNIILWVYYRQSFDWQAVSRLSIASLLSIPVGMTIVHFVPEAIALQGLGILILSYVIYEFAKLPLPTLHSPHWAYCFGIFSGLLSGAYNTGGPPIVLYGNCNRWTPEEFKGNLPGFFLINSWINVMGHAIAGHYTFSLGKAILFTLPAFAIGLFLGIEGSKYLNTLAFKRIVLGLLTFTGIRLLF